MEGSSSAFYESDVLTDEYLGREPDETLSALSGAGEGAFDRNATNDDKQADSQRLREDVTDKQHPASHLAATA